MIIGLEDVENSAAYHYLKEKNGAVSKDEFEEFLREFIPEEIEIQFKHNPEVYCHVDHQSRDLLSEAYISWREFIVEPYILSIVGDWV